MPTCLWKYIWILLGLGNCVIILFAIMIAQAANDQTEAKTYHPKNGGKLQSERCLFVLGRKKSQR